MIEELSRSPQPPATPAVRSWRCSAVEANPIAGTGQSFEDAWAARARANPAARYGRPAELGAYCAFLCSAQAGFITGQNLLIDGGSYPGAF